MTKALIVLLLAVTTVLMPSCAKPGNTENFVEAGEAVSVRIAAVQLANIPDVFEVPGTVRATSSTTLSSKIVGQILSLRLREGDRVRAGQTVAEIDNREAVSQLRRVEAAQIEARQALEEIEREIAAAAATVAAATANRDLAASTLKRYETLIERGSISPQEFDEVRTKHKAAAADAERTRESLAAMKARRLQVIARIDQVHAELESAKIAQSYSHVVSPVDGIVASKPAEAGMLASPGMPIIGIESTSYELEAIVDESRIGSIRPGDRAEVRLDAIDGPVPAQVRNIVPASDPSTRTYQVKLDLPLNSAVRSGYFGRAAFSSGSRQALLAPQNAVVRRGQLTAVYAVDGEVARLRLIKTGKQHGESVEILSGLEAGTRIVVNPPSTLMDGARIRRTDEE
jgi:multidrug efflux pump subunit AcrA (membrane-fusion protein)